VDDVKNRFNQICNLPSLDFRGGENVGFAGRPSFRDMASFNCKRQTNPSVPGGEVVLKWKDERRTGGEATAAAEPGGGRGVGRRIRNQRAEPGGVLPEARAGFVDTGAVPEAAGTGTR
jgi:hypothetical protein